MRFRRIVNSIKDFIREKKVNKTISICMNFCDKYKNGIGNYKFDEIEKDYKSVFFSICKDWFGWKNNRKQIEDFYDELVQGNWKRLHYTKKEKGMSADDVLKNSIVPDMFYFSDRWSIDRLCRIHYDFRLFSYAMDND